MKLDKKLYVFDPFALIEEHSWTIIKLCNKLSKSDWNVTLISCDNGFKFCTVMDYQKLEPRSSLIRKLQVCTLCKETRETLNTFLDNRVKVDKIGKSTEVEDKIQLNERAYYEPVIKFKKTNMNIDLNEQDWFLEASRTFTISYEFFLEKMSRERPDALLLYSPQYAAGSGASEAAQQLGIPTIFLEGSSSPVNRWASIRIWDWGKFGLVDPCAKSDDYLNSRIRVLAFMHFKMLRKGLTHSAYSKPVEGKSIRSELLGENKADKIILAVLSSTDEVYSAQSIGKFTSGRVSENVYADQFEWIQDLCRFVMEQENIMLVIRIHPRDFVVGPNGRASDASRNWLRISKDLFHLKNRIVWDFPSDGNSLYDLMRATDIVTTGWSSVGIETLFIGKPVVTYDEELSGLPKTLTITGKSRLEYFKNLLVALELGPSFRNTIKALKYISFRDFERTHKVGGMAYANPYIVSQHTFKRLIIHLLNRLSGSNRNKLNSRLNSPRSKDAISEAIVKILDSYIPPQIVK